VDQSRRAHARRALELTFSEALRLGAEQVGTGLVLLAVRAAVEAQVSAAQGT